MITHVGSLPRPPDLIQLLLESQARPGADRAALDASVHRAVADVVIPGVIDSTSNFVE